MNYSEAKAILENPHGHSEMTLADAGKLFMTKYEAIRSTRDAELEVDVRVDFTHHIKVRDESGTKYGVSFIHTALLTPEQQARIVEKITWDSYFKYGEMQPLVVVKSWLWGCDFWDPTVE